MLNSKQLRPCITGPLSPENIQQVGIDLNLVRVERLNTVNVSADESGSVKFEPWQQAGFIPFEGKTILCDRSEVPLETITVPGNQEIPVKTAQVWRLSPGVYDVSFAQGVKLPPTLTMFIRQRSSLLRNGALLHSSVFDPGFETNQIGTILHVRENIIIEYNARIAQIYAHSNTAVDKDSLYNGQWQGDKQRNS